MYGSILQYVATTSFPGPGVTHGYSCLSHFVIELLQHTLPRTALEDHFEVIADQECRDFSGNGPTSVHSETPLLHELYCFWLEVLVINYKSLHDSGPVDFLSPVMYPCVIDLVECAYSRSHC